jgi:hypothetical protein
MKIQRVLKRDMTGDDVKYIQTSLNSLGNYNLVINGVFDSSTDSVVKSFQTANGLNPDGIVGPKTVATLEKKLESLSKPASSDLSMLEATIIETAQSFIGQKEISGNMGFKQPFFLRLMESIGWKKSWPWCSLFCKLVYTESYKKLGLDPKTITKYVSPSVQGTRNNFIKAGYPLITDWKHVKPGAYISWVSSSDRTKGHTGILVEFIENGNRMITIEGNTNSEGSREGDSVAKKTRTATVGSGRGLILQGWFNIV